MSMVQIFLKDHSGRDFGGQFDAIQTSIAQGKLIIDLEYSGSKSSKRLSVASLTIDLSLLDQIRPPEPCIAAE